MSLFAKNIRIDGKLLGEFIAPPAPPPPSAPVADFTASPTSGNTPLQVSFTDTSTNTPTSWAWDFTNDGTTDSTSQNPTYTYSSTGTFTVKMTATNAGGSNTVTKTNLITASAPPPPPFTAYTSLLVYGTGTNNTANNTFVDSSTNNFSITRAGNTTQGSFSPFSNGSGTYNPATMGGSIFFDGIGDGLSTTMTDNSIGTGDFTIEMWFNSRSAGTTQALFDTRSPDTTAGLNIYLFTSLLVVGTYGENFITGTGNTILSNVWNHVAVTRSGTAMKLFLNGTQIGGTATNSSNFSNTATRIGQGLNGVFNGYISNFRLVRGTAVYTSNFTAPTAPVTAISGTALLLNGVNGAIIDQTGRNDIETVGTAKVSTAISAGGSMLFDGSGNLSVPNSSGFNFGSGDFTIEFYVNVTNRNVTGSIVSFGWPSGNPWLVYLNGSAQTIIFYASSANGSWSIADGNNGTITSVTENTWYHIAISRSGSSIRTFANGTLINTITSSAAIVASSSTLTVGGGDDNSQRTYCYVEDLIITKGQAKYTSSFTPPSRS